MSYGLRVVNSNSYVQIDSDTPRLCSLYNGTYSAGSRVAIVTFPAAITTPEPPCIFIRNSPSAPNDVYTQTILTGSPGNWTGFQVWANNINSRPNGKWFAAVFATKANGNYGMRIWGANGQLVFDSGATPVTVTRASNSWSYVSYGAQGPIGTATYYKCNIASGPLLEDEYFMINPFSRTILAPNNITSMDAGIRWVYASNELSLYAIGFRANWYDIGAPGAVFARLPGT